MKTKTQTFFIFFFLCVSLHQSNAQKKLDIGFTGGINRYYPEADFVVKNHNNSLSNGLGWSAGMFIEKHWMLKLHPVLEFSFTSLGSDLYLQHNIIGQPGNPQDREYIIKDLKNEKFNYFSLSAGFKYYVGDRWFIYPGFEVARSCKKQDKFEDIEKYFDDWRVTNPFILTDEHTNQYVSYAKIGIGIDLNKIKLLLEYAHGLNDQLEFYDYEAPLGFARKNSYMQFKIQVPVWSK